MFVPPLELSLGRAMSGAPDGPGATTQLTVGLSWASLYPKPTPVDVQIGVVVTTVPVRGERLLARASEPVDTECLAGGYVLVAARGAAGRHWRTWMAARGELVDLGDDPGLGAAARASIELWVGDTHRDEHVHGIGVGAISAWAELGVREQPADGVATFVAAGLGFRLPLMVLL